VRPRRHSTRVVLNVFAGIVFVACVFPVYWMFNTSFLRGVDIIAPTPRLTPIGGTLENYRKVFHHGDFVTALGNSLMVTVATVTASLLLAVLAAFALSRFRFRGRKTLVVTVLVIQMVPPEAMVISLFKVLDAWQLLNTVLGLTLVYVMLVLPFTIWTLRGFVAGIPVELEEAAMVDGCGRLRAFWKVTLPLMAPGLVATAVYGMIQAWNEFVFSLVIMNRPEHQTLPVWLQSFNEGAKGTDWGGVMAGSTLMSLPVLIFFLVVQSRMAQGLTAGAVKG